MTITVPWRFQGVRVPEGPAGSEPRLQSGNHSGFSGRRNAVDTYGESSRHSQTALSGKDLLRINRSGGYAARYAAKKVIAAGLARECQVPLSYAIAVPDPLSLQVETFGTGSPPEGRIAQRLRKHADLRFAGILKPFELRHLPGRYPKGFGSVENI